jgi:hypothetical protein
MVEFQANTLPGGEIQHGRQNASILGTLTPFPILVQSISPLLEVLNARVRTNQRVRTFWIERDKLTIYKSTFLTSLASWATQGIIDLQYIWDNGS